MHSLRYVQLTGTDIYLFVYFRYKSIIAAHCYTA
jgi:hypothetical protein